MTFLDLFFPVTTIALSVALWSCWKSGKPARDARRAEVERIQKAVAEDAKNAARNQFAADVISVLEEILNHRLDPGKYEAYNGEPRYKFPSVKLLQDLKGTNAAIERLAERQVTARERTAQLAEQVHDINAVLRVYHPRNSPQNEFPVIRKG